MFIDFTAVMLVGLAAGFVLLAHYLYMNPEPDSRTPWAAGFFAAGLLGLVTSVPMLITWPLPGAYNIAFGEPALYVSVAFIGAGLTLAFRWEPLIPAIYGFFGGLIAIVVGIAMIKMGLTKEPLLAGVGYLAAGVGGVLTLPAIQYRKVRIFALAAAVALGIAALVFFLIGYEAFWGHLQEFAHWVPDTLRNLPKTK
jgi:putative membrane protein